MRCIDCPTMGIFYLGCPTPVLAEMLKDEEWECSFDEKDLNTVYIPEPLSGLGNAEISRTGTHG